jgi:ribonuclease R
MSYVEDPGRGSQPGTNVLLELSMGTRESAPSPVRRDAVVDLLASFKRALHINEIATRLSVEERRYPGLQRLLDDLSFDGSVTAMPGQRFRLSRDQVERRGAEIEGILTVNPRGFGFVATVGMADDLYIPAESMGGALHGDTVIARIVTRSRRGTEGEIIGIAKRRNVRIAGVLCRRGKSVWIEPDDTRVRGPIVLSSAKVGDLEGKDGEAAVATITRFPESADENPEGELQAVLGMPGDPNVEVAKVLVREAIQEEHSPQAVAEATAFGEEVSEEALRGREDLTHIPLPTIDPETARDHDDAVWVRRADDGSYKAWIAIADVSHYVRPNTAIDAEALARGNSIYLPDRAIPMLPRALSSNLCSLLPGVIRLCMCLEVDIEPNATVRKVRVIEGFMRSAAKLTYPGVAHALGMSKEAKQSDEADAMREDLAVMWELSQKLRSRRMKRGALDFDLPEAELTLDPATGAPIDVQKRSHDPGVVKAYQLIEELMLLANECCAEFLIEHNVPAIFRDHAAPDEAKLVKLSAMCEELGVGFDPEDAADPKRLSAFLKKLAAHPKKRVLHMLLLRAMKQAAYDVANIGHFGLASKAYVHFTSPIRRYPDLVVHRAVRSVLRGEHIERSDRSIEALRVAATTASDCERKAMEVEREVVDLYRALFMRSKIGSILEGTVTGFVGTGVFVAIDSPFVDVLVRMDELGPDQYTLDDDGLRVIGVRSGDRISLGDSMLVEVEDVAILRRTVYARRIIDPEERKFAQARSKASRESKKAAPTDRRKRAATGTTKPTKGVTKKTKIAPRVKGAKKRRPG